MTDTAVIILVLAIFVTILFGVVVWAHRRRIPVHQLPTGQEVISTRTRRRPAPTAPVPAEPTEPRRPWAKGRRFPVPKIGRSRPEIPRAMPTADPRLTGPVLLEAAWQQSVYHGARTAGRFRVAIRVATARGRSHAYEGTAGQDVAGVAWNEDRRAVFAVVADGLGSKADSGQIAREVVDQTLDLAERLQPNDDPTAMIHHVVRAIEQTAAHQGLDGATTLVIAEIRPDAHGAVVSTWGIGDSEAWLLQDGAWRVLHHERRSDAENVTRHLPGHCDVRTNSARVQPGTVVTIASDGFATALATRGNSPVAQELAARWRKPPSPTDFLNQVNFDDSRFNDDRAAVSVWIR